MSKNIFPPEYLKKFSFQSVNLNHKQWLANIIFLLFLGMFLSSNANAFSFFEKKYRIHDCRNESDAYNCMNCSHDGLTNKVEVSFKINERSQSVIRLVYVDDRLHNSENLSSCSLIDEDNWICEEISSNSASNSQTSHKMTNGKYALLKTFHADGVYGAGISSPPVDFSSFMCGK